MNAIVVLSLILALCAAALASHHHDDDHGHVKYHFDYGVHDPHTGDKKEQHEDREGKHVKGGYSFKEADGTLRVVEYESGPHNGFNAVVKRIGHAHHPSHYGKHGHGHGHGDAWSHVGTTHFGYHH